MIGHYVEVRQALKHKVTLRYDAQELEFDHRIPGLHATETARFGMHHPPRVVLLLQHKPDAVNS